jgi:uncharacterized protein (DUF433 family)
MSIDTTNPPTSHSAEGSLPRQYKYLLPKRNSNYKQLFVMGRIFPWTLHGAYVHEDEPMTMEQIAVDWDIPLEAVQEAIAYYESNPPEMQADFRREEALAEATGMNDPNYKYNPQPRPLTPEQRAAIRSA